MTAATTMSTISASSNPTMTGAAAGGVGMRTYTTRLPAGGRWRSGWVGTNTMLGMLPSFKV